MSSQSKIALLACLLLPSLLVAYTGIGGGRGLFRVQDALVDEAGLNVGLHLAGRNPTFVENEESRKGWIGDLIAPSLHYIPLSTRFVGLEGFASWGGIFQYADYRGKKYDMGLHDLKAGAKLSIPVIPVLKLGGMASYTILPRSTDNRWIDDNSFPYREEALAWAGLASLRFQDLTASAPNLLFNYGKSGDQTIYGAGVELAAEGLQLFTEITSRQPDATSTGIFDTENGVIRLTPGVTFGSRRGLMLSAGYSFSFSDPVPNEVIVGLNVATPFFRREPPQLGTVVFTVTDEFTGQPVPAVVSFPDRPKMAVQKVDPGTGVLRIDKLQVGAITVRIEADGYSAKTDAYAVEPRLSKTYSVTLRPLVTYGKIAGTVTDAATGRPLAAVVEFPGSELKALTADPATGSFRLDNVPTGTYTATAATEGYFKSSQTVDVRRGEVTQVAFALSPSAFKTTITGQVTDRGTGAALAAKLSLKDARTGQVVAEVNTDPGTGIYVAEIPVGTYAVTATSEGYIDQSAAVAADKDRTAKQDFALVKPGTKVTLKNIYFDFNKATIKLPQSQEALDAAAKILNDNPTIRVEIQGHTDNVGSDSYNQQLSEKRAWSVVNHLVQNHGIAAARLTAVGYGEAQPVADNSTEAGRALNRRVEFVVLGEIK
uniref:OmpA-like domain-containing protein n=1 Tax=candidate division WOR-3 bacterium TaxID=2052148 RepID=A0A7C4CBZ8_UNCW3